MLSQLATDVLNSLTAHIAILDGRGIIVDVNEAWKRFAVENGAPDAAAFIGADYLAVCERAAAGDPRCGARAALEGLHALMRGEMRTFSLEYACHSPKAERWFVFRATRSVGDNTFFVVSHQDVTLRRQSENALRDTEHTLRQVLDTLPVGVWILDRLGGATHGNPAGRQIWGGTRFLDPERFGEHRGWWLSNGQPITAEEWASTRALRKGAISVDEEIEIECSDGTRRIILNSAFPLRGDHGEITGAIVVNQDITARKQAEKELEEAYARECALARTDPLTGAFNRRHFLELADRAVAAALRYRHPLSVILFDLDDFKQINDTAGHHAGDEALRLVAAMVETHLREVDLFARYGGDEFILLLPQAPPGEAAQVAERIRAGIVRRGAARNGDAPVTISCGVAGLLPGRDSLHRLVQRADDALYRAKQRGRNRTVTFDDPSPVPA